MLYRKTTERAGSDLQVDQLLKVVLFSSITGIELFMCPFIEKGKEKRKERGRETLRGERRSRDG